MPHFLASSITLPALPFACGDFEFVYEAFDMRHKERSLILVRHRGQDFFLRKIKRASNMILKCEKSSHTQPTGVIKNALKVLLDYQSSILSHNLNNNSLRQNLQSPYVKTMDFFLDFAQPCLIEVGFGSGRHLLHLAQHNPMLTCIGIEIHTPSIEQILRQIQLLHLNNLFIIKGDARILLEIMPSHIAEGIYVHFPVPWNKKPHRRVFSHHFLRQALRVLKGHKMLHLRSDDEIYIKDALHLALQQEHISLEVHKNIKDVVTSKYEARWEREHKDIYDIKIFSTQNSAQNHQNSTKIAQNMQKNFLFDKILRKNLDNYTNFPYKKIAKDWFLHIDNVYCAGDTYVLGLCLGDFNQPQNKFLQIGFCESQVAHYINGTPIPTLAAIKAHKHLMQILT